MERIFDFWFDNSCLRYVREDKAIRVINGKEKSTLVLNVLGINPQDIKVDIDEGYADPQLMVSGITKDDVTGREYSIDYRIILNPKHIKQIEKSSKNGLLYIDVIWNTPQKSKIEIIEK